jgi:integrase
LNAVLRTGAMLPDRAATLTALAWVLEQPAVPAVEANPLEPDVDFYGAQVAAAEVLVGLLRRGGLAIAERDQVWALVEQLVSNADPTPEREASTSAEPLQLSFTALRAQGALALLRYLQWIDGLLPDGVRPGQVGFAAAPETKGPLEQLVDEDPSRAVRAALAAELPVLAGLDREWLASRITIVADPSGDALDAVLCAEGILDRTPLRGAQRRLRGQRLTAAELVAGSQIPARYRAAHQRYLEVYAQRVSDVYATTRHKHNALAHLWRWLDAEHPELRGPREVRRSHLQAFIPYAIAHARTLQRGTRSEPGEDRATAHSWLVDVRCFFADICTWACEDDSPFREWAPPAVPMERHDLVGVGFEKARRRQLKRQAAAILDLEREIPKLRALAARRWTEAQNALTGAPEDEAAAMLESDRFWDWALLELLLQSGLRIEEACELTTLDILKRRHTDGRAYSLLHVKPSKFDRARVLPIGDGLGRVLAEIIRHVKAFYTSAHVPACDGWDAHEKRPRPRAPYLLQGAGHPSVIAYGKIRARLARLSLQAGARRSDGSELVLRPHDCRRAFASEHLNNNTPIHVIQALLGHASPDTVMVYAKLYPATLVDEYRKTVRATYADFHGPDSLRAPNANEWQRFAHSLELRDMGTHLCALPAGEHCARGLVCLGCSSAQPKRSAAPTFRRMLTATRTPSTAPASSPSPPASSPPASSRSSASAAPCAAPRFCFGTGESDSGGWLAGEG